MDSETPRLYDRLRVIVHAIHLEWDSDNDSRVGKMLIALAGEMPVYRADITAFLTDLSSLESDNEKLLDRCSNYAVVLDELQTQVETLTAERDESTRAEADAPTIDCEYWDGMLTVPEHRDGWWRFEETIIYRFKTEEEARSAHRTGFLKAMKR